MDLETKKLPVTGFKATSDATGTFTGYVAVFNNLDGNGDVIEQGAFTKTLAAAYEVKSQAHTPFLYPLLWQHNETEPIGGITDASEDTNGLYIKGQYDLDTQRGAQAYRGTKMGYLTGLSIGYRTVKSMVSGDGARHLLEIQLFEGSPVTFPANDLAQITSVKARSPRFAGVSYKDDALARQLEQQMAVMGLETKAASILAGPLGAEIDKQTKRLAEIDTKRAKIRRAIAAMSALPDSTKFVEGLRADLANLDHEHDEADPKQAKWQAELRAIRERHALERQAHERGERVPSIHDPEAYVLWLQRQRALPYIELARDLNEQSRRGMR